MDLSRLRSGELIAGAGALALLVLMFAAPWYGLRVGRGSTAPTLDRLPLSAKVTVNGWDGLPALRWLIVAAIAAGLALTLLQAGRRAPALPVSFSVITVVLGFATVLALIYRVLIDIPGGRSVDGRIGAYLGLGAAALLTAAAFRSLREESPATRSAARVPTITLSPPA